MGGLDTGVAWIQGWPGYRGGLDTGVAWIQGWPGYRGGLDIGVATFWVSRLEGVHCIRNRESHRMAALCSTFVPPPLMSLIT